jgi:hypothetical protein
MPRYRRSLSTLSTLLVAACGLAFVSPTPQRTAARPAQQRVVREAVFQPVDCLGGAITGVAVAGHYAYLDRGLRLEVLDITDPLAPRTVGRSALLPGRAQVAAVADGQAYMVERFPNSDVLADRLFIVDVTDPAAPRLRGRLDLGNSLLKVVVRNGLLYGAGAKAGLLVLDVHDPDRPRYLTTVATDLAATGVAADGVRLALEFHAHACRPSTDRAASHGRPPRLVSRGWAPTPPGGRTPSRGGATRGGSAPPRTRPVTCRGCRRRCWT